MNATTATTSTLTSCQWCGVIHTGTCPRVKAIEYFEDGTIKRVEFHEPYAVYALKPPYRITDNTSIGGQG